MTLAEGISIGVLGKQATVAFRAATKQRYVGISVTVSVKHCITGQYDVESHQPCLDNYGGYIEQMADWAARMISSWAQEPTKETTWLAIPTRQPLFTDGI